MLKMKDEEYIKDEKYYTITTIKGKRFRRVNLHLHI